MQEMRKELSRQGITHSYQVKSVGEFLMSWIDKLAFGAAVITPRWLYVLAAATPRGWAIPR